MNSAGFRDALKATIRWVLRWRHPFWWLPDVPSEQDESFRRIWSNLRQIDQVTDGRHETKDFVARKGDLVIVCFRVGPELLDPQLTELNDALAKHDYVRLVPENLRNITIQELGYLTDRPDRRDEINQAWLDEYLEQCEISLRDFRPFQVTLGGANSYSDAAFLDVHDGGWFSRMHEVLVDFVSQPPRTRFPYLPEFVLAQYVQHGPMGTLVHDLTPFRDRTFARFRVEAVEVIAIPTTSTWGEPKLIRRYPLGITTGFMDRVSKAEIG